MNQISERFEILPSAITGQIASLIHVVLACAVTSLVLKKRKELLFGVFVTLLVVWFIPLIGPACVAWGLRSKPALKSS
jgi:hypothetical protein